MHSVSVSMSTVKIGIAFCRFAVKNDPGVVARFRSDIEKTDELFLQKCIPWI